jgi:hypothetical protein
VKVSSVWEELYSLVLEMKIGIFGMEHFENHCKGRQFTLFTYHKLLEKLGWARYTPKHLIVD